MRFGLIGYGLWGRHHATAIRKAPGAVLAAIACRSEATAANDDGRLPNWDKGTRVVVFANTPADARQVAAEIAKKAYWNSSYFGGELLELKQNRLLKRQREDSEGRCPGPQ